MVPAVPEGIPALDRLQATLGGEDFEVVPLSIDRGGVAAVRRFFRETGVEHLAVHLDAAARAPRDLGAIGLPTTNRAGREAGRPVGGVAWDTAEMMAFLRARIAEGRKDMTSTGLAARRSREFPSRHSRSRKPAAVTEVPDRANLEASAL